MKIFAFDEERKCPECNWETSRIYILATTEEEANKLLKEDEFMCGNCLADLLVENETIISTPESFDPDDYDIVVPNWLTKEEAEEQLKRKLTKEEWESLKEWITDELSDETSEKIIKAIKDWEKHYLSTT